MLACQKAKNSCVFHKFQKIQKNSSLLFSALKLLVALRVNTSFSLTCKKIHVFRLIRSSLISNLFLRILAIYHSALQLKPNLWHFLTIQNILSTCPHAFGPLAKIQQQWEIKKIMDMNTHPSRGRRGKNQKLMANRIRFGQNSAKVGGQRETLIQFQRL